MSGESGEVADLLEAVAAWEMTVESTTAGAPPSADHAPPPMGSFNESQQKVVADQEEG